MNLYLKTLAGLEPLAAEELKSAGATSIVPGRRGISFEGDSKVLYSICMHSRFSVRVLRHLTSFEAATPDDLYRNGARFAWENILAPDGTFVIDATVNSDGFSHSHFAALKLKDAIVDRFRGKTGQRPSIDKVRPDLRLNLHIAGDKVTLSVDASGDQLSRRGYRPRTAKAPLNEVLAAGLLALSGWRPGTPLYDPMCGSGTFSTEAALWASGLPIQAGRKHFAFMDWSDFDPQIWKEVRAEAMAAIQPVPTQIFASDQHPGAVRQTMESLGEADVEELVDVRQVDFFKLEPRTEGGVMVLNPPYGERMDPGDVVGLYEQIGDRLKFHWPGFDAWVISSNDEALKRVGLRPHKRIPVFNGALECRWAGFSMYKGSKADQFKTPRS
jgi:putative N6-adenine-specific DNA methylase